MLQHVRAKYACRTCEGTERRRPDGRHGAAARAAAAEEQLPHPASPHSSPYRNTPTACRCIGSKAFSQRYNISVSRTAMACWMIKLGDLVHAVDRSLQRSCSFAYDVLQMDETTVQVLKEEGRAASKDKSFMWVRRGGAPGQPVILFDYAATRAASRAVANFSTDYQGFLQSDDYSGYNAAAKRDGVKHVGCLDHARRQLHQGGAGAAYDCRPRARPCAGST